MRALRQFWLDDEAQDLIEYSLLIAFLALFCAVIMGNAQEVIDSIWHRNTESLQTANSLIS